MKWLILIFNWTCVILYYSESTLNSSDAIVSTVGLGSSPSTDTKVSSFEEPVYRPGFVRERGEHVGK